MSRWVRSLLFRFLVNFCTCSKNECLHLYLPHRQRRNQGPSKVRTSLSGGGQPLTSVFKSHPRLGYNYICIRGGCAEDSLLGKDSVAATIPARRGGRRRGGRRRGAVLRELRRGYGFPRRARRPFELPKT